MRPSTTLGDYWSALLARKWIVLAVAASACAVSVLVSYILPPLYEAKASFYVPANTQPPSFIATNSQGQSRQVQGTVLKPVPAEGEAGLVIGVLKSKDIAARVQAQFPGIDPAFLAKNVDFSSSPQFFADVYVRGRDPKLVAQIANAYVDAYREFHTEKLRSSAAETAQVLEHQRDILERQVGDKTTEIRAFQQQHQLLSEGESEQRYVAKMRELERQLDDVSVELRTMQTTYAGATSQASDDSVVNNPVADRLAQLRAREASLREQLALMRQTSSSTISELSRLDGLTQERRTLQEMMSSVELNEAEAKAQAQSAEAQIVDVQFAQPPTKPQFPIPLLNGIVGFVLGLVAGSYNALLLEYVLRLKVERARLRLEEDMLEETLA